MRGQPEILCVRFRLHVRGSTPLAGDQVLRLPDEIGDVALHPIGEPAKLLRLRILGTADWQRSILTVRLINLGRYPLRRLTAWLNPRSEVLALSLGGHCFSAPHAQQEGLMLGDLAPDAHTLVYLGVQSAVRNGDAMPLVHLAVDGVP